MTDALATTGGEDPMNALMAEAIKTGGVESLKELVALKNQQDDRHAKREFNRALAEFQRAVPAIGKNRTADFATKSGGRAHYRYADLGHIANTVRAPLAASGFSYSWSSTVTDGDHPRMVITCTLRHENGHTASSDFICPIESNPLRSGPQNGKAALTFGQRASLIQVLGLTDTEDDTDAQRVGETSEETISPQDAADLEAWCDNLAADKAAFLVFLGAASFDAIPASELGRARMALRVKEKQREAKS